MKQNLKRKKESKYSVEFAYEKWSTLGMKRVQ